MARVPFSALYAIAAIGVLAGGFLAGQAQAQQNLPGSVQPGQIERRFQPPPSPKSTLEPIIIPTVPEKRLAPAEAEAIHFTLSALQVTGSTVYKESDFLPLYQDQLGKDITVAELYKIADAITAKYRNDGYILSRAYVPPQTIKDGIAQIAVIEGYVDKVRIDGEIKGRPELFQDYGEKIKESRPLQLAVLERYLLLAGDLAGASVKSVFEPSADNPGAATLVVILQNKPIDAQIGLDNRGTASLGPIQLNMAGGLNSALRLYERSAVNIVLTPQDTGNLQYYHFNHDETLDSEGTKASFGFTYVKTNPGDVLASLDVQGRDTSFTATVSHPFIRSRDQNFNASAMFTYRNTTTDELNARTADDRIRLLTLSGSYDFSDTWRGISQFGLDIGTGLPILAATPDNNPIPSRTRAKTDFTKLNFRASRLQALPRRFSVLAQAIGQISADPLPASEQFSFGGEPFGRAYDPSELTGDSGFAGSVELRYAPDIPVDLIQSSELFTYYDIGEVFNRIASAGTSNDMSAASAGFGFRLSITDYLSSSAEMDKPLTRNLSVNGNKGWRAFFRLTARY